MFVRLKKALFSKIEKQGQFLLFNILSAFLITFFLTHFYSIFVPYSIFIKGYHIHHFYYGILALAIGGTVGMISNNKFVKRFMSYLLGVGVGFVVDELGLLLSCTTDGKICQYQFPSMFDVVIYIATIYIILIFFGNWLIRQFRRFCRRLMKLFVSPQEYLPR